MRHKKSCVPIKVFLKPEDYKQRIRSPDQDPSNPAVTFHEEWHSNQMPVSMTDPEVRLANKGMGPSRWWETRSTGSDGNRHWLLVGVVEPFRRPVSGKDGGQRMIDHFHERYGMRIKTVGADKRYFVKSFLAAPFKRRITPHICGQHYWTGGGASVGETAEPASGVPPSQRARKKIEEFWSEAKCWHGFRRFRRRGLL